MTRNSSWATLAFVGALAIVVGAAVAGDKGVGWTQWGGPNHNFVAPSADLAESWPEDGPPKLWTRELGEGYSAILVDSGRLYTMYRDEGEEIVVALDAASGKTIWEHRYEASPREGHSTRFGEGPRATPLIVDGRIYTIGVSGKMLSLNKKNGKVRWSHDLWGEKFDGSFLNHGYSSSPIAYEDKIYVLVGGEESSIVAFNRKDGKVAWKKHSFKNSYSTPRVLNVDGEDELVTFMANELVGLDPHTGDLKWRFEVENDWGQNINMPVMADKNHLFLSSLQAGARGLKLTRAASGEVEIEEIWATRKIQFHYVTSVRQGDYVYGSTGPGPSFMSAVNIRTGEIAWRTRDFARANVLLADGRLIILDEDGNLGLASASPEGLEVHSKVQLLEKVARTVPTVVGSTMFVRDQTHIMAFDLR